LTLGVGLVLQTSCVLLLMSAGACHCVAARPCLLMPQLLMLQTTLDVGVCVCV